MALGHAVDDFVIAVKRGALRSDASNAPDRAAAKGAPAAAVSSPVWQQKVRDWFQSWAELGWFYQP
ncbi:MAG TPA: hypothetical protein VFC28_07750 [Opitutaceae bacterium]|nr:hypothetical protein [Opitutaceae bacterium]